VVSFRLAAAAVLALVSAPQRAHAGEGDALLGQAQLALDDIDFEGARALVAQAIEAGDLDAAQLALAYRVAGEVAASVDDAAAARDHFVRWLLLDPAASLGDGQSPKIVEPFTAAQVEVARLGAFTVEASATRAAAKIRLALDAHDPLALIEGFRVRLASGALIEHRGLDVELPADDDTTFAGTVIVFDAHGNTLAEREVSSEPTPEVVVLGPTTRSNRFPTLVRWPTWAVLTGVTAGIGGYFAVQVRGDRDDLAAINADPGAHSFDEVTDVTARGDRHALYANLAFGVAAAAAITTVLTFVLEPGPVTIEPAPGGASAMVQF